MLISDGYPTIQGIHLFFFASTFNTHRKSQGKILSKNGKTLQHVYGGLLILNLKILNLNGWLTTMFIFTPLMTNWIIHSTSKATSLQGQLYGTFVPPTSLQKIRANLGWTTLGINTVNLPLPKNHSFPPKNTLTTVRRAAFITPQTIVKELMAAPLETAPGCVYMRTGIIESALLKTMTCTYLLCMQSYLSVQNTTGWNISPSHASSKQ